MKSLRSCALLLCCALAMAGAQARYDRVEFFHLIERNDASSTRKALAEGEFSANTFNQEGFSALYLALREPAPAAADVLIEDPRTQLNLENAWGENALMMAALRGLLPQAIRMMELGAQVNKKGWAPLHYAASSGHLPMIQLLLDNYAYIDAQSPTGETPLMMAAARGTPAAVQMLLQAEADPHIQNKKRQTALAMALERGNTDNAKTIRDWLLRGGKPAPSPTARPKATENRNSLPIGSGSAAVNNYGAAIATPTPSPQPSLPPAPTTAPTAAVTVQAVPEPRQAAAQPTPDSHPQPQQPLMAPPPDSASAAKPSTDAQPASSDGWPLRNDPRHDEVLQDALIPAADSSPEAAVSKTSVPAVPAPSIPAPMPSSVADFIAQPASRALLQILSQPAPAQP